MFCGFRHMPDCSCGLCRIVRRGYMIPNKCATSRVAQTEPQLPMAIPLKKPELAMNGRPLEAPFNDGQFESEYPTLASYLTTAFFDDRSPRQTATLLLFVEGDSLKACLNDRHNTRSAFFTSPTFQGLLSTIEAALCADNADWRVKQQNNQRNGWTPF
jgi:hypothetical protein